MMLNELNNAALLLLHDSQQMMLFLDLHSQGVIIASIFWGLWLFPLSYLIYKSGYFPKIIGTAVIIGGFGYRFFFLHCLCHLPNHIISV